MSNDYRSFPVSRTHIDQMILLVLLLIFQCPRCSKAAVSGKSETIKVKIIANLILMPGYVNNSPRMDVVLDTGASVNILMPEKARELKLKSDTSTEAAGLGKGQNETAHVFSGVSLAWGIDKNLNLRGQVIAALPIHYISQQIGYQVSGIFGNSLFQNFRIRVNYEDAEVTFTSGEESSSNGTAIPIKIQRGTPLVEAVFETERGERVAGLFLVDSGTTGNLILNKKFLDAHPSIAMGHPYVSVPTVTAVGGSIEMKALRITGLDLGPFHLTAPVAAVPSDALGALGGPDLAGFIGAGILSRFTVDWNYHRMIMNLTPNRRYGAPFETDASGMHLIAEGPAWKRIRVEAVTAGGPAALAGIQVGDIVQRVNSEAAPPLYELEKSLVHPGASIVVTIVRSGKPKTMTIHLRRRV